MARFLIRMAIIAMLIIPVLYVGRAYRDAVTWLELRSRADEARGLAQRIARDSAQPDPTRLPADLDRFAAVADLPGHPETVAAIKAAIAWGDLDQVAKLADRAAEAEAGLVLDRSRLADTDLQTARNWTRAVFALGLAAALFQACLDLILRRLAPTNEQLLAETDARERELRAERVAREEAAHRAEFLLLKLHILEERLEAGNFSGDWHDAFQSIKADLIDIGGPPPGGPPQ